MDWQVLDECYKVLREVVVHKNPPKSYELLQELRDISSMAMEHFEEHIVPTMKRNQMINSAIRSTTNSPRFIRCLADAEESDGESPLPSTSGGSLASSCLTPMVNSTGRTLNNYVRSTCPNPPVANTLAANLKIELVVQQNRMLINNQKRQIIDLKNRVRPQQRFRPFSFLSSKKLNFDGFIR